LEYFSSHEVSGELPMLRSGAVVDSGVLQGNETVPLVAPVGGSGRRDRFPIEPVEYGPPRDLSRFVRGTLRSPSCKTFNIPNSIAPPTYGRTLGSSIARPFVPGGALSLGHEPAHVQNFRSFKFERRIAG
jgi:hypothetical protein